MTRTVAMEYQMPVTMTRTQWRTIAATVVQLATTSDPVPGYTRMGARKIDAIKYLRSQTDCGLIDALHAVDKLVAISEAR